MPYEGKYAGIDKLTTTTKLQTSAFAGDATRLWNFTIRDTGAYNALKAAVDVYRIWAESGRLPEALPMEAPKDPFSGREFEYEITATGFILRSRAEDLHANRVWQYEFTVQR